MAVPELFALDYIEPGHFGSTYSLVLGVVILGIFVGGAIATLLVRAVQLMVAQRQLNEMVRTGVSRKLSAGPNRVIKGVVEPTEGSSAVAIAVEITQHVENKTSNKSTWHEWKEDVRNVETRPFYLVQEDGESVYVEPNQEALVIDGLETVLPKDMPARRLRTADVKQGETFYVSGDLHRGAHPRARSAYRDAAVGWVMRPPRRDRMLFATNVLAERYAARSRALRNAGILFVACFLLTHSILTMPFLMATAFGEHIEATANNFRSYTTKSKSTTTTHYVVALRIDDGTTFEAELPEYTWDAVRREEAPRIPVLYTPRFQRATFAGDEPHTSAVAIVLCCIGWAAAFTVFGVTYRQKVPWYDTNKFNERGGEGHWHETR